LTGWFDSTLAGRFVVTADIISDSPGVWLFRHTTDVIFLYDGNRKAFSDVDVDQSVISADDLLEQITVSFSFDEFKKVAFSQSVEAKLGVLNHFILDYQTRHTWRDFVEYFQDFTNSSSDLTLSLKSSANKPSVSGTGFFITADGYLISNNHVVKGAAKIRLVTSAGTIDAKVVQVDAANDLALLKAVGRFAPLPIAASRTVKLGGTVATVGFPDIGLQGFAPKLAKGEIASLSGVADDPRYFQISVPVQPGNSGGALVDAHGNVVGIVAAKLDASAALAATGALPENVNYAVKSSLLLSFLESVPDMASKLKEPNTEDEVFEDVVKSAQDAAVLVLVN
jgi:S1-C subfamily serine protease